MHIALLTKIMFLQSVSLTKHFIITASPDDFCYTNQGENPDIDGVDDAEEFENTKEAMLMLGNSYLLTITRVCFKGWGVFL